MPNEGEIDREKSPSNMGISQRGISRYTASQRGGLQQKLQPQLLVIICPIERMLIIKSMQAVC